ncbi:MAG: tRNA epoxyqueuosine(34) reductase QueG [Melioribacteraceae bacterium]|nr:tRNA epoxyqueuosine(34) reductase QueG [Melioribacteraceae bacterium]
MIITNEHVIHLAKELGFELVGFSKVELLKDEIEKLKLWLQKGFNAKMDYMNKNIDKRFDVKNILPNAKSVISLGMNYYFPDEYKKKENSGKVSRYAWGKDYHLVIWEKLELLESQLKNIDAQFESKSYVDTGPIMDKIWAVKSGLGWQGKHSNIISRKIGSWFFIANIITNVEFNYNTIENDFCGTCIKCIEACPTNAIVEPYVVDSNKCISYLTIENKENIENQFKGKFDNWIFGCDICQDVCPWNNKFSFQSQIDDFKPINKELILDEVLNMNEEIFKNKFETSPIKRAKLKGLKRNAEFILIKE